MERRAKTPTPSLAGWRSVTKRRLHSAVILATGLLVVASPRGRAHAEDAPKAPTAAELSTARALFEKGLAAEDEGRFDEGLALFAQVRAIAVSPAVDYHLGSCHEHLGHLVEALNAFELAAQEAERKGDAAMLAEAHAHIRSLRGRAARLVIEVPRDAEDARITLDGAPLHVALAGTPTLVNPGRVRVMVSAGNYASPFEAVVSAAAGKDTVVRVDLGARRSIDAEPASPGEPSAAPAAAVAGGLALAAASGPAPARGLSITSPAPPAASATVATEPGVSLEPASRAPVIIASAATVGFGAAAIVTGALAHQDYLAFQRENAAPSPGSFAARQALHDRGRVLAVGSTVLTIAAVVDAGVIVALIVRSIRQPITPSTRPSTIRPSAGVRAAVMATPWLGPSSGGVSIGGAL